VIFFYLCGSIVEMSTLRWFCRLGQRENFARLHFASTAAQLKRNSQKRPAAIANKSATTAEKAKSKWNSRAQLNSRFRTRVYSLSLPCKFRRDSLRIRGRVPKILGMLNFRIPHHFSHFIRSWRASSNWFYFILAFPLFIYSSQFRLGVCLQSEIRGRGESHGREAFSQVS